MSLLSTAYISRIYQRPQGRARKKPAFSRPAGERIMAIDSRPQGDADHGHRLPAPGRRRSWPSTPGPRATRIMAHRLPAPGRRGLWPSTPVTTSREYQVSGLSPEIRRSRITQDGRSQGDADHGAPTPGPRATTIKMPPPRQKKRPDIMVYPMSGHDSP